MTTKNSAVKDESQKDFSQLVLTNRDVYFIRDNFALLKGLTGFIFVRETNRNLAICENYIKALSATIEPTDEYKNGYLKELAELELKYADKEGDKVVRDRRGNPLISSKAVEFNKEVEKLQKKHQKEFDAQEKKVKEFNANFDEPAPIQLYTFSEKQVPPNITMEQYKVILHMVDYSKGMLTEEDEEQEEKTDKKKK